MKTRIMTMLTALLLSVSAFAQSGETPLKGDVNEDGKVDVADINAVIKIMKDAGGTAEAPIYYWYVGTSVPTSIGGTGWTSLGTNLSSITYIQADTSNNPDYTFPKFYVVLPASLQFKPYSADGSDDETAYWTNSMWTINNDYILWTLKDNTSEINSRFKK